MWAFLIIVIVIVFIVFVANAVKSDEETPEGETSVTDNATASTPANSSATPSISIPIFGVKTIKREKIKEQWSMLIEGADGEGERVIISTVAAIEKLQAPNIHVSRQARKPDAGFIKTRRQFLIAEHRLFDTYDMYISARDYGKQLFVSWYLVEEPVGFWRMFRRKPLSAMFRYPFIVASQLASVLLGGGGGKSYSILNLFDTEELSAYVTTVHHALLESIKTMMEDQKLDSTKIERRTRGILNIV